jgi:hypothetical protein
MTTLNSWEIDGVPVWQAQQLDRPHVTRHEKDGPLMVVEITDYVGTSRLLREAVALLERCADISQPGEMDHDIDHFLARVSDAHK